MDGNKVGIGVERGVQLLELAELLEELAVKHRPQQPSELRELRAIFFREARLGQKEPRQVALPNRQGALALVESLEPEVRDRLAYLVISVDGLGVRRIADQDVAGQSPIGVRHGGNDGRHGY